MKPLSRRAMLAAVTALALFSAVALATSARAASSEHITTTLYAYPTESSWAQVTGATPAGTVTNSIVDICDTEGNGPGCNDESWTDVNPDWTNELKNIIAAKIRPLIYIPTDYGAYSLSQVEGWLSDSITDYGVASPMFDEMEPSGTCTNGGSSLACTTYYKDLYTYATGEGATEVMFNAGTTYDTSSSDIFGSKEVLQVFEGPATTQDGLTGFESETWPSWMKSYAASYFSATISAGTGSTVGTDVADAISAGIGNFYEDDEAEPSPGYSTLPAFWSTEVSDVSSGT
jgi:Spherulation-specific family 4